jgi:hypothetical protein
MNIPTVSRRCLLQHVPVAFGACFLAQAAGASSEFSVTLKTPFDGARIPPELIVYLASVLRRNGRFPKKLGAFRVEPAKYDPTVDPPWMRPLREVPPQVSQFVQLFIAHLVVVGERGTGELSVQFTKSADMKGLLIASLEGRFEGEMAWAPLILLRPDGTMRLAPR